ncbi:MAG: polyprenyl synthetase family protein [Nitrospinae bacterium]|nr:polyprenyl synthetase family protein [Nitrospinota bacterium]
MTASLFDEIRREVERELTAIFDRRSDVPEKLLESMRYSVMAGGKRLRPVLVVCSAEAVGGDRKSALPTAAAFELIHTYTLVHDDLPAMDNDDLRRGMPTNHKKFGDATAILAGDGLLTLAFEVITEPNRHVPVGGDTRAEVAMVVARAVGAQGTVGGQQLDMEYEGKESDLTILERIHALKTGVMITSAVKSGAMLGGAGGRELSALGVYGDKIGLAFQVFDDILDVTSDAKTMGKNVGGDVRKKKTTYPALMGLEQSKVFGEKLIAEAEEALSAVKGNTGPLRELARYVAKRNT